MIDRIHPPSPRTTNTEFQSLDIENCDLPIAYIRNVITMTGKRVHCYVLGQIQDEETYGIHYLVRFEGEDKDTVHAYCPHQIEWE